MVSHPTQCLERRHEQRPRKRNSKSTRTKKIRRPPDDRCAAIVKMTLLKDRSVSSSSVRSEPLKHVYEVMNQEKK
jgi:hypothetical protein